VIEGAPPGVGAPLLAALPWLDQLLIVAVSSTRFATAFVFLPIFSQEIMPGTVRNSIIVAFGLVALNLQPSINPAALTAGQWALMLLKEAAAGGLIGFFFGTALWAMRSAGEIIDIKVGATTGQLVDPFSGNTTSVSAILLERFAQIVFVSAGGITFLVGTIMASYAVWPIGPDPIAPNMQAVVFFEVEFGRFFVLAFLFAAPVLVVLYVIDAAMGFLNRFAQQFNVFSLAMPIKAAAALMIVILCLPLMANAVIAEAGDMMNAVPRLLDGVGRAERGT
jgi:type III secretion protein T